MPSISALVDLLTLSSFSERRLRDAIAAVLK
jgi:hypothetical protein